MMSSVELIMEHSDGEGEVPPGWTKSKSEWDWYVPAISVCMHTRTLKSKTHATIHAGKKLRKTQTPQKADAPDGDAPSIEQLLQTQSSLQALCDLKDVRIAKEAGIFSKNNMCLSMHSNVWNIFEHSNVGDAYCYYH